MTVILIPMYLECIKTGAGEITEEPYLSFFTDPIADSNPTYDWEHEMQSGSTRQLNLPPLNGDRIAIHLYENDPGGCTYDDRLGGLEILDIHPGRLYTAEEAGLDRGMRVWEPGMREIGLRELDFTKNEFGPYHSGFHYVTLPYHEGSYDHEERRYRLYFYYYRSETENYLWPPYCLELVSLECKNAQEWKDYPYIKVNGLKVWGPYRMRDVEGDSNIRSIDVDPIPIYEVTSVMLWEEDDNNRDDLFGEFEIRIGRDFEFTQPLQCTYAPDHSIGGDARYILTYRVRQRERTRDGIYDRCPDT